MKYALIVLGLIVIVGGVYFLAMNNGQEVDYSQAILIFEKSSGWGPCESGDECTQKISVYSNGALVVSGKKDLEKNIGVENVEKFIKAIKDSGVIGKECAGGQGIDFSATYKIYLDDKITTIVFPGCDEELRGVDVVLDSFIK